ncbi:MAG: DUF2249 domain-containing protein [Planctomycetes bacterium]|nr:DUF2249 domain-containing protein [Planctomycetota bacterium]
MVRARILDVSGLEPPQPMILVLELLRSLAPDEYVVFRHRHEPRPLYPILGELGFAWRVREGRAAPIEVVIWPAAWDRGPEDQQDPRG